MAAMLKILRAVLPVLGVATAVATGVGCAPSEPSDDSVEGEEALSNGPTKLDVYVKIAESKVVYSSRVESFGVKDGASLNLPCQNRAVSLTSKPKLYDNGWTPEAAPEFAESVQGARYEAYLFSSCRNADTQVFGWFAKAREYEFTVPEQLLYDDYSPREMPLVLQYATLGSGTPTYYTCDADFTKTQVGETETEKKFEIGVSCKKRRAPTKAQMGPIDFVNNPGSYAAVASYNAWMLPPVASTQANLDRARQALFGKIPEGKYSGAMSTLTKLCGLEIKATPTGFSVDHTIKSSNRVRHLELKAEDLLGFVEGDLYTDPIRVTGAPAGKFVAAEFKDNKGESTVIRFEQNTGLDSLVVRIDGSEAYCRRLVRD
jgi:hypothetical protein